MVRRKNLPVCIVLLLRLACYSYKFFSFDVAYDHHEFQSWSLVVSISLSLPLTNIYGYFSRQNSRISYQWFGRYPKLGAETQRCFLIHLAASLNMDSWMKNVKQYASINIEVKLSVSWGSGLRVRVSSPWYLVIRLELPLSASVISCKCSKSNYHFALPFNRYILWWDIEFRVWNHISPIIPDSKD